MAKAIQGRSLGQIAWLRLKRDKWAIVGGVVIILLVLGAVVSVILKDTGVLQPNIYHPDLIDSTFGRPIGTFGGISGAHPLGVDPSNGRDLLSRVLVGSQYSLL